MNKILFATTNPQKVIRLNKLINAGLDSLVDLPYEISEPEEIGEDCLDIAILKARHYWKNLKEKRPVLTQDDTLKLEVEPEDSPNNYIKKPVIEKYGEFNDKNAITYYTELAKKYGGEIQMFFEYGHALCFSDDEETIVSRKSRLHGKLVVEPRENDSTKGYFLSAIMQVKIDGNWKYYSELTPAELVQIDFGIAESLQKLLSMANLE